MNSKNLIAHRGDNTNYPENTLIAIEAALKAGATSFEFDVQMNADQRLVAFHDIDFLRMNGNSKEKIVEVTDDKMKSLSIHQPQKFDEKYIPTSVSYIEDILELLNQYPDAQAFVEIKDESLEYWGLELVMDKLLKSLEGFEKQASIISFNYASLIYTKKHSLLKVGFVFEEYSERIKALATELNPEYLVTNYKVLPKENVWEGQWLWMVYTVNEIELAKELLERGDIEFVETDDIQLLLKG